MPEHGFAAGVIYSCTLLLVFLLVVAARNDVRRRPEYNHAPIWNGGFTGMLASIALWCIVGSLVFAGLVDVMMWAIRSDEPSVSDRIHYYLNIYPFIGWIAAGICYHLLVESPRPPHLP